jgi:beta-lactamase superfamily II metal-dependent hydrolase
MITETFDNRSEAIINPMRKPEAVKVDVCIVTFSHEIEKYVAQIYRTDLNGEITCISDGKEISMYFEGHNYDRTNESENYNKDSRMGE